MISFEGPMTGLYGKVYIASGGLGIDGNGYWYDKFLNLIPGHSFKGATFIAKTVTIDKRDGNLPLKPNMQPKNKFPKCINFYPFEGSMMNAVGVSSPGLEVVLDSGVWYTRTEPFLISIIPVRKTSQERKQEIDAACSLLRKNYNKFGTFIAIQLNVSCPNTEIHFTKYIQDVQSYLDIIREHRFLVDLKVNVLTPPEVVDQLRSYQMVTCSNTIPFGTISEINWKKYSGLESMGGGGLSGPLLLPYVIKWIKQYKEFNKTVPIKACGGIFSKEDVDKVVEAGADAIEIGTVKLFRPHRIKGIIKRTNELLGN
jgi:dihydroorotate dehydrogenase (NAD+) catalytic subunit